jgi:hypothetical protein
MTNANQQTGRIRRAEERDVPEMVALSGHKRREYAVYQPVFWREAENSDAIQKPFFAFQVAKPENIVLVCEQSGKVAGFIIAGLVPSPPVYAPGGLTCAIDDFALCDDEDWTRVGLPLLEAVAREAKSQGAVQMVVVCGHLDQPKREMLAAADYAIASEWYVQTI